MSLIDKDSNHVVPLEKFSLHDLLSYGNIFPFEQSLLHDFEHNVLNRKKLLLFGIDLKSDYHQIGLRYGLHTCLVKSFGLTSALNVFMLNHILHALMGKIVIISFDDITTFNNTWENSLACIEFDCGYHKYAIEFSSYGVGCDLSIPLMTLFGFECVNVNGKGKVNFVLQIRDEIILIEAESMIHCARQFGQYIERLQGSDLDFVLVVLTCDCELFDFLVIKQRELVDLCCFVFNPGIQMYGHIRHDEFQELVFDPGSLTWMCLRMFVIIRFTFDPGIRQEIYLRMDRIIRLTFDPGIREWELVQCEEFYTLIFDPGGYRTFLSFNYFIIYAYDFLGRDFDCILAIVAYLVCFGVVNTLEVSGIRVEEHHIDVDMFLGNRDRKLKFPCCATRRLQNVMLCRASLGRKHMRDVHVNSRKLPDSAMCFAGVRVFDDHFSILTCVIDIVYIFYVQVEILDYESFDTTDLTCLSVGLSLWNKPFPERWMQDLRTNPFEEEGSDTILVRLASDVNNLIQHPEVQRMIVFVWAEICSRTLTLEFNSSISRVENHSYDLGLLDTIYLVRPNQRKSNLQSYVHLWRLVFGKVTSQFMKRLAYMQHCECSYMFKGLCFITRRHKVAMQGSNLGFETSRRRMDKTGVFHRRAPRRWIKPMSKRLGADQFWELLQESA